MVYRLIFVFVAEERDALLDPNATEEARERYRRYYASRRVRDLADRRRGGPHGDLWRGLVLVMEKLDDGYPALGLPALGSWLWGPAACSWLMEAECANEHVLRAIRFLSHIQDGKTRYSVNWRNVGADELGSVYESLLERHPQIHKEAATFELETAAGHERKTTGSYYTPTSLVDCLLDSALDPVLDEACRKPDPEAAVLDLKVCDPACGSGHFLVAAARRIAKRLAAVRSGDDEPSPRDVQTALRDVVGHCIFGVDLNPMAVELCKVSLWMEAIEPGKPLSFLDSHIQCGNALLGATPALMSRGIPDDAFKPIEGDDKDVAKRLRKRTRDERRGQTTMFGLFGDEVGTDLGAVAAQAAGVEAAADSSIAAVREKERRWDRLSHSAEFKDSWFRADAWCAAFVWPKEAGELEYGAITEDLWRRIQQDVTAAPGCTRNTVRMVADQNCFLHWHLAFPTVFGRAKQGDTKGGATGCDGGFDAVLGNPPWERIKLQEKEFFSARAPDIAGARNAAARKKLVAALPVTNPGLWEQWSAASRKAQGTSHFVRHSGLYPLCGKGDVNTYALFAEHNWRVLGPLGRAGFIVPSGIVTDDTTKEYFQALVEGGALSNVFHFENEERVFPAVHHAFRFILLTIGEAKEADLVFYVRSVTDLADKERHFALSRDDFGTLNPNTRTCPTFRSRRDAELNISLYRRAGILWRDDDPDGNPWVLRFMRMLDMANDSGLFRTVSELEAAGWAQEYNRFRLDGRTMVPLLEAKMFRHFDHRFGTYDGQTEAQARQGKLPELDDSAHADPELRTIPRYWVDVSEVEGRLEDRWDRGWLLGWRDICRSTDKRTVIASIIPLSAVGHTAPLMFPDRDPRVVAAFYANLTSFALDYAARQKVVGTHLTYGYLKQLPVLAPSSYGVPASWDPEWSVRDWLLPRVLELTYTAWDLEPFARDCDYQGPPFRWDAERRFRLRAELDAAFFHLYDLSRADTDHILDSFPVVQKKDEKAHGEYRTKRVILEAYDALGKATATGKPFVSPLPPALKAG